MRQCNACFNVRFSQMPSLSSWFAGFDQARHPLPTGLYVEKAPFSHPEMHVSVQMYSYKFHPST